MTSERARYPLAIAALERLLAAQRDGRPAPLAPFSIGPGVLRATPSRAERPVPRDAETDIAAPGAPFDPGEVVEMVLVGADEAQAGRPEVHLVFKSDVLGGLHLVLIKEPDGLRARFVVEDASARRDVAAHIDDLIAHLRGRGMAITSFEIEVGSSG